MPDVNILINANNKASGPIKQVGGEIDGLSNKANNAAKGGLANFAGAIGTALKVGAVTGIAALGALGGAVAVAGTNFNNMREQAQIAFTTMLKDGTKAKAFLDDLQKFAATTPFEFPELVSASQKLLAMGFAAEDVKPTLTAVGDAVAGLGGGGEMIGRVTTALGQMQAKGKVSAEEMMQLTEAGIPAWQMLADKIGVSVPEAMDMVSGSSKKAAADSGVAWRVMGDGVIEVLPKMKAVASGTKEAGITAADAISAITEGMKRDFGGLMEAQSKTFGGLVSTLKDTFAQVSGQVMGPFFEKMTKGLQMIVDWTSSPEFTGGIADLTKWLQMAANAAGAFFGDLLDGQGVVDALTHAFRILLPPSIYNAWTDFLGAVNSIYTAIEAVVQPVMDVIGQFVTWKDALAGLAVGLTVAFAPAIATAIGAVGAFVASVAAIAAPIAAAIALIASLRVSWTGDWKGIVDALDTLFSPFVAKLKEWGVAAWQWILEAIPVAVGKLKEWGAALVGWVGNALPTFLKTLLEWGTALYAWIGDAIPKAIDSLTDFVRGLREKGDGEGGSEFTQMAQRWANTLWRWIREDLIPAVGPAFMDFVRSMLNYGNKLLVSLGTLAKELGLTLWDWIVTITPVAVKKLSDWGGALWGWIKDNAPAWKDKVAEWGKLAWRWILDITPLAIEQLGKWAGSLWDWLKTNVIAWKERLAEWGVAAWEWITEVAIPGAVAKLGEWGTALTEWVTTNWPIWRDDMLEAGQEMIDGLRDGIEIAWIRLTDWFFSQTAFGGFVGDILELLGVQLGPAYGVMYKNGERIAYSLNEGSRNGLSALRQTGSDMGSAISSGLKTNMDMHSPSRVMWGFGQDIMAGLSGGVREGIGGLKSEMQYVADTIKATMQRANDEMLASVEYFTNQALVKAQAAHYKIANAAQDASAILKQLNIDTSKAVGVIGGSAGGTLLLPGTTNLPKQGTGGQSPSTFAGASGMLAAMENWQKSLISTKNPMNDYLNTVKSMIATAPQDIQNAIDKWLKTWQSSGDPLNDFFKSAKDAIESKVVATGGTPLAAGIKTLGEALGIIKDIAPVIASSVQVLGGITLTQQDLDPQGTKNRPIIDQAISSAFNGLKTVFGGENIMAILATQSESTQQAVAAAMSRAGDMMKQAGTAAGKIRDEAGLSDVLNSLAVGIANAFTPLGNDRSITSNKDLMEWLKTLLTNSGDAIKSSLKSGLDAMKVKDPLADYIAGIGDFLSSTLKGANSVFGYLKFEEEKAFREGKLKEFMGSETAQTKTQLKGLYQGLQNSIADILGISPSDLNVTGGDSLRLIDRLKQLTSGTNADTNMDFIGSLLQTAVNFRNLSNFGTGAEYFKDVLPTDGRLTGGSSTATTNNFNITLAPGANASDDLISTFNLLNSMYGTAAT